MAYTVAQLRAATDEELIRLHDELAETTQVGTRFYLDELERRSRERAMRAAEELSRKSHRLAVVNGVVAAFAVIISLIALFVT